TLSERPDATVRWSVYTKKYDGPRTLTEVNDFAFTLLSNPFPSPHVAHPHPSTAQHHPPAAQAEPGSQGHVAGGLGGTGAATGDRRRRQEQPAGAPGPQRDGAVFRPRRH